VDELITSDHKAVHSIFDVAVKTIVRDKRRAVEEDITRQLDTMENRTMPKVVVSETVVRVADVVYGIPSVKTLTIENVGEVAATWRFTPKPEERWFCKTWMTVEPAYGMIPPGGRESLTVTITVDDAVARDISLGRELALLPASGSAATAAMAAAAAAAGAPLPAGHTPAALTAAAGVAVSPAAAGGLLEDILILRMERGRDYYITVSATVLPTAFGCSLQQLARRPEPMRALALTAATGAALTAATGVLPGTSPAATGKPPGSVPAPDLAAGSHRLAALLAVDDTDLADAGVGGGGGGGGGSGARTASTSDASRKGSHLMSVPKEVWRLVDVLFSRGMDTRGLFLAPGDDADILELRECLDTGEAFPAAVDMLAVAQVLLDLLESLREPVIPCLLFPGPDVKSMPVEVLATQLLKALAPLNYNVLVYLVRFGREVLTHAANNGTTADDLAYVFSRCMMRRVPHDEAPAHQPLGDGGVTGAGAGEGITGGGATGGGGGGGGGREDEEGTSAGITRFSLFADRGTRWEPTRDEQDAMTRLFVHLLTTASLA